MEREYESPPASAVAGPALDADAKRQRRLRALERIETQLDVWQEWRMEPVEIEAIDEARAACQELRAAC